MSSKSVVATNGKVHDELIKLVNKSDKEKA
jgi:hypothetical protein